MLKPEDHNAEAEGTGNELCAITRDCIDALAGADAEGLEQIALRCRDLLNRFEQGPFLNRTEAKLLAGNLLMLNRVLHATQANLKLLEHVRDRGTVSLEYAPAGTR